MTRAWQTIAQAESAEGPLELRRRGGDEFLITVAGRVLMNSRASRSEIALAELACRALPARIAEPRVLIGGLGMGCTLRAALDALPQRAEVCVAELNPDIVDWCRGPLAEVSGSALVDERVRVETGDVAELISGTKGWNAIVLDLYEGPREQGRRSHEDPFFGPRALEHTRKALAAGGVFALWSEAPQPSFETGLRRAGFEFTRHRPGRGGLRHAVYVARKRADKAR